MKHKNEHRPARHAILMALACLIPLALLLVLPLFGISGTWTTVGVIVLMVVLHAVVMKEHFLGTHNNHKGGKA